MKWRMPAFLKPKGEHSSELPEKVTLANYLAAVGTECHGRLCCPTPLEPESRKSGKEMLKALRKTTPGPVADFFLSPWDILTK